MNTLTAEQAQQLDNPAGLVAAVPILGSDGALWMSITATIDPAHPYLICMRVEGEEKVFSPYLSAMTSDAALSIACEEARKAADQLAADEQEARGTND